jgi:shikimate dehydrogenase
MSKKAIKLGVIGYPVKHSKSPLIHKYWIEKYGLSGVYDRLEIPPQDLAAQLPALIAQGYRGFNLTVPHKELVVDLCDHVDDLARAIGAVNTIRVDEGGAVHGTNTDMFGFIENLKQSAPDFDFTAAPAVILGAGGAARAAVHGLLREGVPEIILLNRTRENAEKLAQVNPDIIVAEDWEARHEMLAGAGLLVNTTTLGMEGQPELDIDLSALPAGAVVNDIVYTPLYTPLLQEALVRNLTVVTGIGMLLQQARPAFEAWFGVLPELDAELDILVGA